MNTLGQTFFTVPGSSATSQAKHHQSRSSQDLILKSYTFLGWVKHFFTLPVPSHRFLSQTYSSSAPVPQEFFEL
jgi:hypothetical protein